MSATEQLHPSIYCIYPKESTYSLHIWFIFNSDYYKRFCWLYAKQKRNLWSHQLCSHKVIYLGDCGGSVHFILMTDVFRCLVSYAFIFFYYYLF